MERLTKEAVLLLSAGQNNDIRHWNRAQELGIAADEILSGDSKVWEKLGISESNARGMSEALASKSMEREAEECARRGISIICCTDSEYPAGLLDLDDAPLVLYVRGQLDTDSERSVGVVGTRRCSSYAWGVAKEIGTNAAQQGLCVVSGGAKGIDGASHEGALERGGPTVAVMGTGMDVVYPREHVKLFQAIAERGALVTEYRLGTKGEAWRFPKRNRIIAALCGRLIIVEAPFKSGAMITSRLSMELGREVWAVPGRISDERTDGSNQLIFDGAHPLVSMEIFFGKKDAQRTLFGEEPEGDRKENAAEVKALSPLERGLLEALTRDGDMTVDALAAKCGAPVAEVYRAVSVMALTGVIKASGPGRYKLND